MDKNNQYGNAMTKQLPYDCIKKASKVPPLLEFNIILDRISDTEEVGHLFILHIKFHDKTETAMLFDEISTPIFEKNKVIQTQQRSVLQLMSVINRMKKKIWSGLLKQMLKLIQLLKKKKLFFYMQSISIF